MNSDIPEDDLTRFEMHRGWLIIPLVLAAVLGGCASKENKIIAVNDPDPLFEDLSFGVAGTFEIVTWNLENFPGENIADRVEYASTALGSLQVDIVGLQEITDGYNFRSMVSRVPGYDGHREDGYQTLAFVWNTATVTVNEIFTIYEDDDWAFPRPPLVMDCTWGDLPLIVINNHLKAMSGSTNVSRRESACRQLEEYISENHPDDRVIVLGDMNDELVDAGTNVFQVFLDLPQSYRFVDIGIATGPYLDWSYPGWPSHLDHILITDELFAAFDAPESEITTLKLDQYLKGGFREYEDNLSDHRPVALRLSLEAGTP